MTKRTTPTPSRPWSRSSPRWRPSRTVRLLGPVEAERRARGCRSEPPDAARSRQRRASESPDDAEPAAASSRHPRPSPSPRSSVTTSPPRGRGGRGLGRRAGRRRRARRRCREPSRAGHEPVLEVVADEPEPPPTRWPSRRPRRTRRWSCPSSTACGPVSPSRRVPRSPGSPAFAAAVDPIEAPPAEDQEPDPVAVLADDLARRLRRALADEQNQVLDRLRQDRRGPARPRRPPGRRRRPGRAPGHRHRAPPAGGRSERGGATGGVGDLAARLAGEVADGVRSDIERRVAPPPRPTTARASTWPGRYGEAFRSWRTDRILPMAAEVAAGFSGRLARVGSLIHAGPLGHAPAAPSPAAPALVAGSGHPHPRRRRPLPAGHLAAGHRRLLHRLPVVRVARPERACGGRPRAKIALALDLHGVFFVLLWVNLVIADRLAPRFRPMPAPRTSCSSRYHEIVGRRTGLVRAGRRAAVRPHRRASACRASGTQWLLFTNRVDFGVQGPAVRHRHRLLRLPAAVPVLRRRLAVRRRWSIILVVTAVAHYLNGGIRVQTAGRSGSPRRSRPTCRCCSALLALVKAADYWLQRYELTVSHPRHRRRRHLHRRQRRSCRRSTLLLLISLLRRGPVPRQHLAAGLGAARARRRPVGASWPSWPASVYPAFVQRFQVEPGRVRPRRRRTSSATSRPPAPAMGLDRRARPSLRLRRARSPRPQLPRQQRPTVRQHPPARPRAWSRDTYQQLQVGRRLLHGSTTSTSTATRSNGRDAPRSMIVAPASSTRRACPRQSWEDQHLAFTHGYGAAVAPANAATSRRQPDFVVSDIPVERQAGLPIDQPEIYVGENLSGYVDRRHRAPEIDYQTPRATRSPAATTARTGCRSVSSFVRRRPSPCASATSSPLISQLRHRRVARSSTSATSGPGRRPSPRSCCSTPTRTR